MSVKGNDSGSTTKECRVESMFAVEDETLKKKKKNGCGASDVYC